MVLTHVNNKQPRDTFWTRAIGWHWISVRVFISLSPRAALFREDWRSHIVCFTALVYSRSSFQVLGIYSFSRYALKVWFPLMCCFTSRLMVFFMGAASPLSSGRPHRSRAFGRVQPLLECPAAPPSRYVLCYGIYFLTHPSSLLLFLHTFII